MRPIRVLIADNHVLIRAGLRALLRARRDFNICGEAANGREAVAIAFKTKPNVVVMNVNLPRIDGIEATRQIRARMPETEILIFTAENNEDLLREALRAGARGYLLKSASDQQIIGAIEALASRRVFTSSSMSEKLLDSMSHPSHSTRGKTPTVREREILRLVAQGHRGREIASMLGISLKTVDTHRAAVMRKLDLHSVAQVVRYAIREKIIQA
jgi:DNA-binding NarL/FixJ family response regulator